MGDERRENERLRRLLKAAEDKLLLLKAKEEEIDQLLQAAKQKIKSWSVEILFTTGLPSLDLSRSVTPTAEPPADAAEVEFCEFSVLDNIQTFVDGADKSSGILAAPRVKDKQLLRYTSESDIHEYVKSVLRDMLYAAGLHEEFYLLNDVSLNRLWPDILVIESRDTVRKSPVCCIVLKPLGEGKKDPLDSDIVMGQIYDYMLQLKTLHGQNEVFGFVTTYTHSKILTFPDMAPVAACRTENIPCVEYAVPLPTVRKLIATEKLVYSDPRLLELLVTILRKSLHSRRVVLPLTGTESRVYGMVTEARSMVCTTRTIPQLFLSLPNANTKKFSLIRDFKHGAHGRVLLACSGRGNLIVLKFILSGNGSMYTAAMECAKWVDIFRAKARCVKLLGHTAVAMPFAFHCHLVSDRHVFVPVLCDSSPLDPTTLTNERLVLGERVAAMVSALDPETMARQAINTMVEAGYVHQDIHWRHVAALPVLKKPTPAEKKTAGGGVEVGNDGSLGDGDEHDGGEGDIEDAMCSSGAAAMAPFEQEELLSFRGIFIDLTRAPTLKEAQLTKAQAKKEMLEALGLGSLVC